MRVAYWDCPMVGYSAGQSVVSREKMKAGKLVASRVDRLVGNLAGSSAV